MARFLVKASEFKNVCKAVNDRKLAELKKEIIEILKKQDENEVKKAVDYFNSQELHYTHLEKSLVSGKWIEKAGYGVGTVRVWKGKKYKKIAPGKWARVFEKEGRGTNIAIGKLIARVQKIDNVEDLMAFVMENKQRFVDENGVDLPVLNKLRAAVDARNGNVGSKEKTVEDKIKENPDYPFKPKTDKERAERAAFEKDRDDFIERMDKIRQENKKKDSERLLKELIKNPSSKDIKKFLDKFESKEDAIEYVKDKRSKNKTWENDFNDLIFKIENIDSDEGITKPAEKGNKKSGLSDDARIALLNLHDRNKDDAQSILSKYIKNTTDETQKRAYEEAYNYLSINDMPKFKDGKIVNEKPAEKEQKQKEESKTYWIQDSKGNRITNEDAKARIKDQLNQIDSFNELIAERSKADGIKMEVAKRSLEEDNKYLMDRLNPEDRKEIESETENYQNRSDAMKGNKNAVKVGGDKKVIGTFTKKDDNSVEMDATKENKVIFDSLNKALSKDKTRAFMTDVYYDGEYLNSTNGYSLVSVKVGDIGLDKGFVKVDSNNGKINVSAIPDKHSDYIPPYKTVIPENNNQEVNIDNKKLKQKLKAMKAEGAYTKDNPIIALEFKDGNVVLDDTVIGKSDAKFADDKNAIYFVADNLSNMITNNKDSTMFVSDNPEKAIAFSDDSSDIVLMPAKETVLNYEGRRNIKKENDEYEAKTKQKQQDAMNSIVDTQKDSMSNEWVQSLINKVNNKEMENHKTIIEHAYKALKDAEKMIEKPTKKWTSSLANNKYGYSLLAAVRKNPEFKTALENMAMEYGLIKKSLFDDFIVDVFEADDEEELEHELYEGETEYNDYSAEQPELFNSTSMKVREALDRIRNQVL